MGIGLGAAFVTSIFALVSAIGTMWTSRITAARANKNSLEIELLRLESERSREKEKRRKEVSAFSEPLTRATYDLQSRLFNIIKQNFAGTYLQHGSEREKEYVVENTTFLICQYFCWTEIARKEIQFIDLGEHERTRKLTHLQDTIQNILGSDEHSSSFRIFAGEQRAAGEALIKEGSRGSECIGYGTFLKVLPRGTNPLIDIIRNDVRKLATDVARAEGRLRKFQNLLIELLDMLDPDHVRFPAERRSKA
jgi:hypothetical protein